MSMPQEPGQCMRADSTISIAQGNVWIIAGLSSDDRPRSISLKGSVTSTRETSISEEL